MCCKCNYSQMCLQLFLSFTFQLWRKMNCGNAGKRKHCLFHAGRKFKADFCSIWTQPKQPSPAQNCSGKRLVGWKRGLSLYAQKFPSSRWNRNCLSHSGCDRMEHTHKSTAFFRAKLQRLGKKIQWSVGQNHSALYQARSIFLASGKIITSHCSKDFSSCDNLYPKLLHQPVQWGRTAPN